MRKTGVSSAALRKDEPRAGNNAGRRTSSKAASLHIGDVAKIVGTTTRTIRYYEDFGLLGSVKREENGRRIYTDDDVRRLKFISRLKVLGLSLEEMRMLEKMYISNRNNAKVLKKLLLLLDRHLASLDGRVEELLSLKKEIESYRQRIAAKI